MATNVPVDDPHLFIFDLDIAIRDQVIKALDQSPLLSLAKGVGPKLSGIYALYWKGELVYIGKATKELTKSKRDLRTRLNEHVGKIETRQNITLSDLKCRFLTFESEWWVIAAEYALIVHLNPEWNNSGFGSKAEGAGHAHREIFALYSGGEPLFPQVVKRNHQKQAQPEEQAVSRQDRTFSHSLTPVERVDLCRNACR